MCAKKRRTGYEKREDFAAHLTLSECEFNSVEAQGWEFFCADLARFQFTNVVSKTHSNCTEKVISGCKIKQAGLFRVTRTNSGE